MQEQNRPSESAKHDDHEKTKLGGAAEQERSCGGQPQSAPSGGYTDSSSGGHLPAGTVSSNVAPTNHDGARHRGEKGSSPRLVIRGESLTPPPTSNPRSALIDWLNFSFPFKFCDEELDKLSEHLKAALGFSLSVSRNKGHLGYTDSWELGDGYGILATGGKKQGNTCLVSLSGEGCAPVRDWQAVHDLLVSLDARITRVDLAHDDFVGVYNIVAALEMLALGQFTANGRPPCAQYINDFDSGKGKTVYIGNRKNGKFLRVYEKGKQLGDPQSPWVRWEVELHNKDRKIPLEVLLRPGDYLAGAYPCLNWISDTQDRITTTRAQLKVSFEHLVKYCRQSYGKLLYVMHEGLGRDPLDIIQTLSVEGIPSRLDLPIVTGNPPDHENAEA